MPPSMSVASLASVAVLTLLAVLASAECDGSECEDTHMVQVFGRREMAPVREIPWYGCQMQF